MALSSAVRESIWGRRFGIQYLSSPESGSTHQPRDWLVGPNGIRVQVSTAGSTSVPFHPYGVHVISTESSGIHSLSAPIAGVEVFIYSSGGATGYVKTVNGETVESSRGSTFNTMIFNARGSVHLVGLTTARYLLLNGGDSGTTSQSPFLALATST